jgi:hypothetical protein
MTVKPILQRIQEDIQLIVYYKWGRYYELMELISGETQIVNYI